MSALAQRLKPHWRTALGLVVGAAGGAAWALTVGCQSGGCAITSNPWTAAIFFGAVGAMALKK